jgi:hypothetical protein
MLTDDEEIAAGYTKSDSKFSFVYFKFKDIKAMEDGSLVCVMEETYTLIARSKESTTYFYHTSDIMIYRMNGSGKLEWINLIRKKTSSPKHYNNNSFVGYWTDDEYIMFFGDKMYNYDEKGTYHIDYSFISNNKDCAAKVKFDINTGRYVRTIALNKENLGKMEINPLRRSINYVNQQLVVLFNNHSKEIFGTINFTN